METSNSEKVKKVLDRIEAGESERSACKAEDISRSTFRTTALREQAGDQYARALEGLALDQIEKLEATIDDMRGGKVDHQVARIEIDARKWFASKFLPKRFGDKLDVSGESTVIHKYEELDDEQLEAAIKARKDRIA